MCVMYCWRNFSQSPINEWAMTLSLPTSPHWQVWMWVRVWICVVCLLNTPWSVWSGIIRMLKGIDQNNKTCAWTGLPTNMTNILLDVTYNTGLVSYLCICCFIMLWKTFNVTDIPIQSQWRRLHEKKLYAFNGKLWKSLVGWKIQLYIVVVG